MATETKPLSLLPILQVLQVAKNWIFGVTVTEGSSNSNNPHNNLSYIVHEFPLEKPTPLESTNNLK
jgi:hypothetical protein